MRNKQERFFVSEEEQRLISEDASRHQLSKSSYYRYKLLGEQVNETPFTKAFSKILVELRKADVPDELYERVHKTIRQTQA